MCKWFSSLLSCASKGWGTVVQLIWIVGLVSSSLMFTSIQPLYAAPGQISGNVFRDYNADGERSNGNVEPGITGIQIFAYDVDNNLVAGPGPGGSWATNAAGDYAITGLSTGQRLRLEFRIPTALSYLQPGAAGPGSGTTLLFATSGDENRNVGFNNPTNYCQDNPDTVTSCFVTGAYTGTHSTESALVKIPYGATGNLRDQTTSLAKHIDVGTVYGLAYQQTTKRIYASAFYKRFTGFGAYGPDAIYQMDPNGTVTGVINLSTIPGGAGAGNDLHNFTFVPGTTNVDDAASYSQIGRASFGDMDISEDMSTLYVVNLADRKIYAVNVGDGNVANAAVTQSWETPDACTASTEHRPFALAYSDGTLYIGSVCEDASNAYIHSLNSAQTGFNLEVTVPLNYSRERIADAAVVPGLGTPANPPANWNAWNDSRTTYFMTYDSGQGYDIAMPQPMLGDIEFDNGHMILGFRDRFGDQAGIKVFHEPNSTELYTAITAGDLLRVCRVNNSWILETGASGSCSPEPGAVGPGANSGPGGEEYYYWDFWGIDSLTQNLLPGGDDVYHYETMSGGLLQVAGKETVLTTALNPLEKASAGYLRLNNRTGQRDGVGESDIATPLELEKGGYTILTARSIPFTFGKSVGLGDIEALCNQAPIEVGNRVWFDVNGNGVQDADESPLFGVVVGLYDASKNLMATTTTGSQGTYFFSSAPGSSTASAVYGLTGLVPGGTYTIGLLDTNFAAGNSLEGYGLTRANADSGVNSDVRDSDGQALVASVGTAATNQSNKGITFTVGRAGANDHTFDFGLIELDFGDLPEGNRGFVTTGANGANHQIITNIYLGNGVDRDIDGQPTLTASGDDNDGNDDEDGIIFVTPLVAGRSAQIDVSAHANGYLNAWIDFNGNGNFEANEQISTDQAMTAGNNTLIVAVPGSASGTMYSRFRFTREDPNGDLGPTGSWFSGEVEDYVLAWLGDKVWLDSGVGNGVAGDGIQNGAEPGVQGVTVQLLTGTGQPVLDANDGPITTVTDATGMYSFPGVVPGSYQVKFTPPPSYGFTQQNVGTEAKDSDANQETGITNPVTLEAGEINPDVDAGLVPLLSLGNLVWMDVNNNGRVDGGEKGIPNVSLTLWTVDQTGSPLAPIDTQATDLNGNYLFENLIEGDYIVQITSGNFAAGSSLAGGMSSTGNGVPAPDPDNDVDNNDNGDPSGGLGVLSQPITLSYFSEPTYDGDNDNNTNLTLDFGFYIAQGNIDIEKATNGEDADDPTGPLINIGSQVTWSYVVRNIGSVALANIQVTDNIAGVRPTYVSGDTNNDKILQVAEVWTYRATGTATAGQYANIGRVEGNPVDSSGNPILGSNNQPLPPVSDADPSHYFGLNPTIDLEKATNGPGQQPQDADQPTGPGIRVGDEVTWTYVVKNTGNVALANVVVADDLEGEICSVPLLAIGATRTCTATGTARLGQYANVGTVTGQPVDESGTPIPGSNNQPLPPVRDTDPSHYFGNGPASIDIEKDTNGQDADIPTGPQLTLGDQVVWTYVVRNTGELALANVIVTDNIPGVTPTYVNGDNNNDSILQINEVWTYQAVGIATLGQYANIGATKGDPVDTNGNPATDGNGAPLPSAQDSDPSHYVGVANAAIDLQKTVYLGHDDGVSCPGQELVQGKSGTPVTYCFVVTNRGNTYLSDITLDDGDLEINQANMTQYVGSLPLAPGASIGYYYQTDLVVSLINRASASGQPTDEEGTPIPGLERVTDEDTAAVQVSAAIGDYVWLDVNTNGIQDPNESGVKGVLVTLYDDKGLVASTTETDNSGLYLFDNLAEGTYSVGFTLPSVDYLFSPQNNAVDDTIDSDANVTTGRTEPTVLSSGETDLSWDAGIFAPPQLYIEKSADATSVGPNQRIVYSFAYGNDSPTNATGVKIIEQEPQFTTFSEKESTPGWECTADPATLRKTCIYDIGTIKANTEGIINLTFVVYSNLFLPEDLTVINNEVVISDDGSKGNQPSGASTDEYQVSVERPTALDTVDEPTQSSSLYLPFLTQ